VVFNTDKPLKNPPTERVLTSMIAETTAITDRGGANLIT